MPAIVQPGTAAALGPIAFVGDGLIDERRRHLAPAAAGLGLLHRDRDREMRDRVEEVRGAVERVDDETRLARIALDLARLFHLEAPARARVGQLVIERALRSEEHTSELQSLMRISYAVFCLKTKK